MGKGEDWIELSWVETSYAVCEDLLKDEGLLMGDDSV